MASEKEPNLREISDYERDLSPNGSLHCVSMQLVEGMV